MDFEKKLGIFRKNKVDNAKKMSAVCKDLTNLKSLKNPEINLTEASEDSDFNICFNMGILLDLNSFWTKFVLALVYFEDTMSTLIKTRFGSIEVKRWGQSDTLQLKKYGFLSFLPSQKRIFEITLELTELEHFEGNEVHPWV